MDCTDFGAAGNFCRKVSRWRFIGGLKAFVNGEFLRRKSARAWWKRVEAKGDSKRELDYWRGRTALLWVEQDFDGAHEALGKADAFARALPAVGAYDYDRWCLDMLRGRLGSGRVLTNDLAAELVLID